MTKEKKTESELVQEWQDERAAEDLARELAGAERRVAELQAMNAHPDALAEAQSHVKAAREAMKGAGSGQKAAAKRPRASSAKETRGK